MEQVVLENPFVVGKYLSDKYFCDRSEETDFLRKQVLIVDDMVRDADLLGNAAGVLRVLEGAAGVQKILTYNVIFIQTHRAAYAFVAARRHDLSRHAAVDAAAHCNQSFHGFRYPFF